MDRTALRYFVEVARHGSIAAAGEHVHVAGSAVSRQIKSLERHVGARLFERQPRGMVLTAEGRHLADYVRRSTLEDERVIGEIRSRGAQTSGVINMVASEGLASHVMPELIHKFRAGFEGVHFMARSGSPETIAESLREGTADIGMAFANGRYDNVAVLHSFRVPTCVFVSPDHPLAARTALCLRDVEQYLVVASKASTMRKMLEVRSAVERVRLNIVFECNYSAGLFHYVTLGNAVVFASAISARAWLAQGTLIAIPLENQEVYERNIEIQAMHRRTLPAYLRTWVSFVSGELERTYKLVLGN